MERNCSSRRDPKPCTSTSTNVSEQSSIPSAKSNQIPVQKEQDISSFNNTLRKQSLTIRDVAHDGNCFFRAVSDQLFGSEETHFELRNQACDYLSQNQKRYESFIEDHSSFDDYVTNMRKNGIWADNLEIQAISETLGVNIRIHRSQESPYDIINHHHPGAPYLHLSYHFNEHYASVRPLHATAPGIPVYHTPLAESVDRSTSSHTNQGRSNYLQQLDREIWKMAEETYVDVLDKCKRAKKISTTLLRKASPGTILAKAVRSNCRDLKTCKNRLSLIANETNRWKRSVQKGDKNYSRDFSQTVDVENELHLQDLDGSSNSHILPDSRNLFVAQIKQIRAHVTHLLENVIALSKDSSTYLDVPEFPEVKNNNEHLVSSEANPNHIKKSITHQPKQEATYEDPLNNRISELGNRRTRKCKTCIVNPSRKHKGQDYSENSNCCSSRTDMKKLLSESQNSTDYLKSRLHGLSVSVKQDEEKSKASLTPVADSLKVKLEGVTSQLAQSKKSLEASEKEVGALQIEVQRAHIESQQLLNENKNIQMKFEEYIAAYDSLLDSYFRNIRRILKVM